MKRVLIITMLLVVASACTSQAPTNSTTPTNTSANTNAQAPKSTAAMSDTELMAREKQVLDALKNKDWNTFGSFLSDDHVYVGDHGVQDKKSSIDGLSAALKDATITEISMADFKSLSLDKDAVIVTYTTTTKGTLDGKEMTSMPQRNSSVWANRGGKWLAVFHQDTDVAKAAAPSGTGAKLTPKPAVGLTEPDAIAREKQAWEAIEKKDWDAFTSMLADDEWEIESDGVFDKAGTLNGLSQSNDMPKMTLSDFKVLKIDDDAAIVTYTVKPETGKPGATEMHASTVWINRGGKWLAIFHQGTDAQAAPSK